MLEDVTFAIPTYNRNEYLKKLLNSIPRSLNANFAISDNGGYVEEETIQKHKARTKLVASDNIIDMYDNWNKAIGLVQTTWFFIPSDDDVYYEEKLPVVATALQKYPNADIIIFGHDVIDENDSFLSRWIPEKEQEYLSPTGFSLFKYGVSARFPSILFRTSHVNKMGGIDPSYKFTAGDSLLIQKCLVNGNAVFINEVIGAYRTWPNNYTNKLIASTEWLDKVDRWQDEIGYELKKCGIPNVDPKKVKDEVYAQNLLNGIQVMKKNKEGTFSIFKFVRSNRFPWNARMSSKFQILKQILV